MIDITNLTSLITAFRNETEKGSISPETLGALLQAFANELQNASSNQDQVKLASLYENLQTMGTCIIGLSQSTADRNNVLFNLSYFNPIKGMASALRDQVFIKQATTERAGAMRAQQVIDLNATKRGVTNLEEAVSNIESALATTNANNETRFSDLEDNVNTLDEVIQDNSTNIGSLSSSINTLNSRVSVVPIRRGIITIDHTSITSPVANYFKFNMPDGYYELVRNGYLIGHAVSYQYGIFRVFDVVGLCHINSNSFVYQDTLAHILVRVAQNGQIATNGTIDHVDLQNQLNLKQNRLEPGAGIDITGNKISVNVIPESIYTLEFTASDGVFSGNFDKNTYNELRQAIEDDKTIVVLGGVTRTTAVSTALADDYLMIRYCVPRIQDDNATVTLSVYELKISESSYTSKSIHKVLYAA